MKSKADTLRALLRRSFLGPGLVVLLVYWAVESLLGGLQIPATKVVASIANWLIEQARWQIMPLTYLVSGPALLGSALFALSISAVCLFLGLVFGRWLYRDRI